MGYEGSWSGMRRYLEQDMLAEPLRGRVRYNCTRYVNMEYYHIFEIFVDNQLVKRFSLETVNSWFIRQGLVTKPEPMSFQDYWRDYLEATDRYPMAQREEYTGGEFADALDQYRRQDIQTSLASDNPIVRMFAVLDRRVGKRTLEKLKDEIDRQPEWLQYFYRLRLGAETGQKQTKEDCAV